MATKIFRALTLAVSAAALVSCVFTSCNKGLLDIEEDIHMPAAKEVVVTEGYDDISNDRDDQKATIVIVELHNGDVKETETISENLGAVDVVIDHNDTLYVADNNVEFKEFVLGEPQVQPFDPQDKGNYTLYIHKTTRNFVAKFNKFDINGSISYLDGYVIYKNTKKVEFKPANGTIAYTSFMTANAGADSKYNYTLVTSKFETSFMSAKYADVQGYKTLATNAEDKVISGPTKTNEGFEVLTFDGNGNPSTAKSWIELTTNYSLSGAAKDVYEVILNMSVMSPDYDVKVLGGFDLSKIAQNLGSATNAGTRTDGVFTIVKKQINQTVGNDKFTKVITYSYEQATLNVNGKTFEMPYRAYQNITDLGFKMNDMDYINGYDRMLNIHSVIADFAGYDVKAKAETEIRVAETKDEMVDRKITAEGFDFLNENTSNSWIEITETWSNSGKKTYKKSVNLANGITAPAKIQKIVPSFNLNQASANLGSEKLVNTRTVGDFTVKTYEREYTVGNDQFTRTFVLSYEKAVYNPMNHNMIWKGYENVQDGGFTTGNMNDAQKDGKTYNRKSYTHKMTASFNERNHNSKAEAELLVEKVQEDNRTTPHWLGASVSAKYTRVQRKTGEKFMDMVVFIYQNGVVMAPNGVVDLNLIYAFDATVASKNGVETCLKNSDYSGVWTGSKWAPARITVTNGRWIYAGKSASWDHTVMENNAITLGIGVDVTPTPKAQSYKVEGNKCTIKYAKNNGKTTTDTSLELY